MTKLNNDFCSIFRILKGGKISLIVSALLGSVIVANAAPIGGVVTSGNATINQSGNTTNINQTTQKASINWQNFSISSNETVNFNQPNTNSITLNRVIGNEKSVIDGALNANGQVWILNSNGILFNSTAKVNTAGLLATTAELSDADFQNGNYNFKNSKSNSVVNLGTIEVSNNGYVVLASNEVRNSGTIKAIKGKVFLSGNSEYTINLNGNSIVNLIVTKGVLDALVENSGTIIANGGEIYITTNAVNELLKGVVNNTGVIEANSLDDVTGKVEVYAHGGTANVGGEIKAEGGFVETSGGNLNITDSAKITTKKWLLDPTNITIESTGGNIGAGSVSATVIQTALSSADIELQADQNIVVNENISWSTPTKLTLSAGDTINVNSTIENTNSINGGVYFNASNMDDKVVFGTNGKVIINNIYQLQWLNTALRGNYELGRDIDASVTSSWNSGLGFAPLFNTYLYTDPYDFMMGSYDMQVYFSGTFDGKNHTISNLYINRPAETNGIGLFGATNSATIKNIGLINVNFSGASMAGGLIGVAQNTTIDKTYVAGSITAIGNNGVGGLIGSTSNVNITNSYSTANVLGGLTVGGLVGNPYNSTITNSYSTGLVSGNGNVWRIGGLVGNTNATITNSYWNTETSGQSTSYGGTGLTTAQFANSSNFSSWDSSIWALSVGGASVSGYETAILRPYLKSLGKDLTNASTTLFLDGYGTSASPYTITNWTQLQNINNSNILSQNYYFSLLNNLDSTTSDYTSQASSTANSNLGWTPIGNSTTKFSGTFDGLGNTISNLTINKPQSDNIGLFGYTSNATIKNIGIIDGVINGRNLVGSLVGYSFYDTINNSYATGSVSGAYLVGDLIGIVDHGTVSNSYATGSATGTGRVGGLIGRVYYGTVNNSYATGSVSSTGEVGGLIGSVDGAIVNNSFWDNETSHQITSAGGTGKTTAQMQTLSTFSDAGWTITGDSTLSSSYLYPILVTTGGITSWKIYAAPITYLTYTLGNVNTGYIYNGTSQLPAAWSASNIFGSTYSSWVLGTDYKFVYDLGYVTGFTNAGTYDGISIHILKSGYAEASSGNANGSFVIAPKPIDISVSKTYDGNPNFTSGFILDSSDIVNGDMVTVASGSATTLSANANTYNSFASNTLALSNDNYTLTGSNISATINKAHLIVTADNKTKIYGETNPTLTTTVSGFVNGETTSTAAGYTGTSSVLTTATTSTDSGSITITAGAGNLSATNYDFTNLVNGTLTVSQRPITLTATDLSKVYGENDPTLAYSITSGSKVGSDDLGVSLTRATGENVNTTTGYVISNNGTLNSNYDVTFNNGKLLITNKNLTAQVSLKTSEITGVPLKLDGILSSELVSQGTRIVVLDASNNDVTQLALQGKIQPGKYSVKAINENTNYALTSNSVELTINPALDPITVVKTQVSGPVIPVTTVSPIVVNTPTSQKVEINNNLAVKLGVTDTGSVNLVSQTVIGQPNQVVTLSELRTTSQDNSNTTEKKEVKLEDVKVSLNQNSIVQIVNGGVLLPTGVDQQFYVVRENIKGTN